MKTIKPEDYGLETEAATQLTIGLNVVKEERNLLISEFNEVSELEIIKENLPKFKELRIKIAKNRTQGINKWHKANKEFFLTGGRFVDAIKNRESSINEKMEEVLMSGEKHFENIEKERIKKLQSERVSLLSEFVDDASERDLSSMDDDVWEAYLGKKIEDHNKKIAEGIKAEAERISKLKAEQEEQQRLKEENERLKAEAKEKQAAKELLEKKLRDKEQAEEKLRKDAEQKIQDDLNADDHLKIEGLINDFKELKTKYSFKSSKNKKMYSDVSLLIDKVVSHISK